MNQKKRYFLALVILIAVISMVVGGGVASAAPTTSAVANDATLNLIKSNNLLVVELQTNGVPVSAFSFDIVHDGTPSASCTSAISVLNCNPQFDETTIRANYYSALSPLSGAVTLFEMPLNDDMTQLCAENLRFVTADLEIITFTEQLCASESIPLAVTLTGDRSTIYPALLLFVIVIGLIGLLWATRSAYRAYRGRGMFMLIVGLLLGGVLLHASPTSAQTTPTSTLGDLNCDAAVDIVDALLADQYMNGVKSGQNGCPGAGTTDVHTAACDTNLDGACTDEDAEILAHCDVGFNGDAFCHRVPDSYLLMPADATVGATLSTATTDQFLALTAMDSATIEPYSAIGMFSVSGLPIELIPDILASGQYVFVLDTIIEPYQTASWGLDRIDQRNLPLDNTFIPGATGAGVHAYIIDSGVRSTHSEFSGRMGNGFTVINDGFGTEDCNGHGTHVAGTVGGTTYGVARNVTIHPIRVFGCGGGSPNSLIVAAVNWVTANYQSPAVVNMSLGGPANSATDFAVQNSIAQGITYVVAAGNDTTDACGYSPARVANALTVGATMRSDRRPDQNDWGYNPFTGLPQGSNYGSCVDIFAPGHNITSAWPSSNSATNSINGTSMASPHVAGVAALYLQANPSASPAQLFSAIIGDATTNVVTNEGPNSPNRLLYVGNATTATDTPTPIIPTDTHTPTPIIPADTDTPTPIIPTDTHTPTPSTPTPTSTSTPVSSLPDLIIEHSYESDCDLSVTVTNIGTGLAVIGGPTTIVGAGNLGWGSTNQQILGYLDMYNFTISSQQSFPFPVDLVVDPDNVVAESDETNNSAPLLSPCASITTPTPTPTIPNPSSCGINQICLYDGANYTGASIIIDASNATYQDEYIYLSLNYAGIVFDFEDQLTSIQNNSPYAVTLGYPSSTTTIPAYSNTDYSGQSIDNLFYYLRISTGASIPPTSVPPTSVPPTSPPPSSTCGTNQVCLYDGANFTGASIIIDASNPTYQNEYIYLSLSYSGVVFDFENRLTSIENNSPYAVTLGYAGGSTTVSGYSNADYSGQSINNIIYYLLIE